MLIYFACSKVICTDISVRLVMQHHLYKLCSKSFFALQMTLLSCIFSTQCRQIDCLTMYIASIIDIGQDSEGCALLRVHRDFWGDLLQPPVPVKNCFQKPKGPLGSFHCSVKCCMLIKKSNLGIATSINVDNPRLMLWSYRNTDECWPPLN